MYDLRVIIYYSCKEYRVLNYLYVNFSNYNLIVVIFFNFFDCKVDLIFDMVVVFVICVLIIGIDLIIYGLLYLCLVILDF